MQNAKCKINRYLVGAIFSLFIVHFALGGVPSAQAQTCVPEEQCPAERRVSGPCPAAGQVLCATPSEEEAAGRGIGGALDLFKIGGERGGFRETADEPEVVIGRIIQGAMLLIGVAFGILIVYGGYLWMTARGSEEQVTKAIGILQTASIGFVLVLGAYALTNYIVERVISAAYQQ